MKRSVIALCSALVFFAGSPLQSANGAQSVTQSQAGTVLRWQAPFAHAAATLRIAGPEDVVEWKYGAEDVQYAINPAALAEGSYAFEVTMVSWVAPAGLSREAARPTPQVARMSGNFRIMGGVLYSATGNRGLTETGASGAASPAGAAASPAEARAAPSRVDLKDQVIPDDLIVQGSACFGFDCVNNENFGFDTLRLKENNLRIKFEDTSVGSFPTNDWEITANDSASGGASHLGITDVTSGRSVFRVTAGAPADSLFVASTGKVGMGTSTPVLDLHMATSNTPAWRLEQTNAGGFTAQTWDVAGNEANFFVRDVTGGSRLPFRIRPGAPTSSIDIAANGSVGFGTASPAQPLHVRRTDGTAQLLVEEANSTSYARTVGSFVNNGDVKLSFQSTASPPTTWETIAGKKGFRVGLASALTPQLSLDATGNLNITGALTQASSVTLKENIVAVNGDLLLQAISKLPIYTWNYLTSPASEKHLGPTAEDFHRMFALGNNPKAIAPGDLAGVALGAIQALSLALSDKDRELSALRQRMDALEKLVKNARR